MNSNRTAVWVNEHCAFGRGQKKWAKIAKANDPRLVAMEPFTSSDGATLARCETWIFDHLSRGTKRFVAVGGDGTVHHIANTLVHCAKAMSIGVHALSLGAIGTGSSNDFHKPFSNDRNKTVAGFPCRLDFANAVNADLIRVSHRQGGNDRFCLINASVGITAEANRYFNHPDRSLSVLKNLSAQCAILYAAVTTLFRYHAQLIDINIDNSPSQRFSLTNLGVVKNRFFSGSFRYDQGASPDSGDFVVHICNDMSVMECLRTLASLAVGRFAGSPKTRSMRAQSIYARAASPFAVEMDGEVSLMKDLSISIEPRCLNLCQ